MTLKRVLILLWDLTAGQIFSTHKPKMQKLVKFTENLMGLAKAKEVLKKPLGATSLLAFITPNTRRL